MKELLRIASRLDEVGGYELSDKLFKIAQKNTANMLMDTSGEAKTNVGYAKGSIDILSYLTKYFKRHIPMFIKGLQAVRNSIDKFESIPELDKIFKAQDLISFIEDTIDFLNNVQSMGFINYYKTDAKGVTQYFINIISTINMIAGYIPPLAPIKIQLQAIDTMMNALNTMVVGTDKIGEYMNSTNTNLKNFTTFTNPKESPSLGYSRQNGKLVPMDGEIHNVLVDYVLKKGPLNILIDKHIPKTDPERPSKEAQILSAIKQNKLPDPKFGYSKSSYKQKAEYEEYRKTHPDRSFDNYQLAEWQDQQNMNRFVNKNIVKPIQKGFSNIVGNYNKSLNTTNNTGYISPEKLRAQKMQQ